MNLRLAKIKSQLIDQRLDAILISSPANLFYLSQFVCLSPQEREAYLFISKSKSILITSPLYAGDHTLPEGIELLRLENSSHEETVKDLLSDYKIKSIGIEEHSLSVFEYNAIQENNIHFKNINLRNLRSSKEKGEIKSIEKACEIGDEAFEHILNIIKPGMLETDLATELELYVRRKGAIMSFPTIIGFGKNAAIPHHVTRDYKLALNNFVLMDFGVKYGNYASDMTRTVYVGKITEGEKKLYQTVYDAQQKAIEYIKQGYKKGVNASRADAIAREHIINSGYPNFPHTLGHGIGIEVHEAPSLSAYSKDILRYGNVFSVEPGIYLEGRMGVRIEDLMVIDESEEDARLLTKSSRKLIII